ncbi:uncharacterized protein LOC123562671 [Mercenaria mercenaria]|uniref:uncharacterized protein LOC123562671 n=1 Tax=Mercenaria mercenaria TaxID=6596 RepID=UPI00234F5437|nr:uncharacterized protein LOC123562671 [Mercenaria mercenaria]
MSCVDYRWKIFLGSILTCLVILIATVDRPYTNVTYNIEPPVRDLSSQLDLRLYSDIGNITKPETKEKIILLAKVIHNAKKHVRGSKTSDYLKIAITILNSILKDMNVDAKGLSERYNGKSAHICSETFMGGQFGFPLYNTGFETDHCTNATSISKLVTIIGYIDAKPTDAENSMATLDTLLSSVYDTMKTVRTLIITDSATFQSNLKKKYPLVNIIQAKSQSEGAALNKLIKEVKTPYVFVARDMSIMTNDSRLERLVREIESLNVVAAGGSFRDSNGHWKKGCFQTVYRNYTLKYIEGYDESFHECLFCDYIQGPFVTTAKYLKLNAFRDFNENNGLYEDWFLRTVKAGQETIVCPDSMFHVNINTMLTSSNWRPFALVWNLFKVLTPKGYIFTKVCENQKKKASRASQALSPCALQINNNAIKTIMRTCKETSVMCELEDGTALGAVKLGKALPWEFDFDVRFLATNCSKCQQLERALKSAGLSVTPFAKSCCTGKRHNEKISYNSIVYKGYAGDFHGHPIMDSDLLIKAGLAPTKVQFDGQWVNAPRNPGMFVRNKYGKEIYQHAEHWRYTGVDKMNQKLRYKTNAFLPCNEPGGHDCLDRYNADGDLPFVGMLP